MQFSESTLYIATFCPALALSISLPLSLSFTLYLCAPFGIYVYMGNLMKTGNVLSAFGVCSQ